LDARRLKNDVAGEIRRTRILLGEYLYRDIDTERHTPFYLANHDKEDWIDGEKTEDVVAFLDRLYTAKRKVEERIVTLGGEDESVCNSPSTMIDLPTLNLAKSSDI